jgi:hypothetical protein
MPRIDDMFKYWSDRDFNYDREYDLWAGLKHIDRHDGTRLYDVSECKHGAKYTVHFCACSREIWAVEIMGLMRFIDFDTDWEVSYVPRQRDKGLPTARGYLVPCTRVLKFGHKWDMPETLAKRFLVAHNKSETGVVAERAFAWLVNEVHFFQTLFHAPAQRSRQRDDLYGGIDFWVLGNVPVQVKYDGPGGTRGTGKLFFQTHTLPLRRCADWHEYEYEQR